MKISVLVTQMLILFLMIGCGWLSGKEKLLKEEIIPDFSRIVLNIGIPGVVLSSATGGSRFTVSEVLLYLLGFFLFSVLCALMAKAVVWITGIKTDRRLYEFMYMFSNVGFMGLPVVEAVLGKEALIYAVLFLLPNNLMLFSYGEYLMRDKKGISLKKLGNPPVIASMLAIVICLLHLQLPPVLEKALTSMGNITTPMAMLIIGASLSQAKIREMLEDYRIYVFLAIKMLILPILYWLILSRLPIPEEVVVMMILMMAMPVPSNTVIYAGLYQKNIKLACEASVLTSLVCVITIPLVFAAISLF